PPAAPPRRPTRPLLTHVGTRHGDRTRSNGPRHGCQLGVCESPSSFPSTCTAVTFQPRPETQSADKTQLTTATEVIPPPPPQTSPDLPERSDGVSMASSPLRRVSTLSPPDGDDVPSWFDEVVMGILAATHRSTLRAALGRDVAMRRIVVFAHQTIRIFTQFDPLPVSSRLIYLASNQTKRRRHSSAPLPTYVEATSRSSRTGPDCERRRLRSNPELWTRDFVDATDDQDRRPAKGGCSTPTASSDVACLTAHPTTRRDAQCGRHRPYTGPGDCRQSFGRPTTQRSGRDVIRGFGSERSAGALRHRKAAIFSMSDTLVHFYGTGVACPEHDLPLFVT
ncbi:hypothetical protein BIW11_03948, partial [Tropilaelaps mercedesae]